MPELPTHNASVTSPAAATGTGTTKTAFQGQLLFDVAISVDTAALHEAVMHHAQAEEIKGNDQPSDEQNLCNLKPRRLFPFRCR